MIDSIFLPRELLTLILDFLDMGSRGSLCIVSKSLLIKIRPYINNKTVSTDTVANGHIGLIKWFVSNGYTSWFHSTRIYCTIAAKYGQKEMLQWLHDNGYSWDHRAFECAAENGHLDIMKYLYENRCYRAGDVPLINAATNGHLEVLKWLHTQEYYNSFLGYIKVFILTSRVCTSAVGNGHFEIVKWLHKNQCFWDSDACLSAAENGHLEILKYLHENECHWNKHAYYVAAKNGHIEILKYLHENKCPWDNWACYYAELNDHHHITKWLHENDYPCHKDICGYCRKHS